MAGPVHKGPAVLLGGARRPILATVQPHPRIVQDLDGAPASNGHCAMSSLVAGLAARPWTISSGAAPFGINAPCRGGAYAARRLDPGLVHEVSVPCLHARVVVGYNDRRRPRGGRRGGPTLRSRSALRLWILLAPRIVPQRPRVAALGVRRPFLAGPCPVRRSEQCAYDRLGQVGRLVVRVRPSNALFIVVAHKVPALQRVQVAAQRAGVEAVLCPYLGECHLPALGKRNHQAQPVVVRQALYAGSCQRRDLVCKLCQGGAVHFVLWYGATKQPLYRLGALHPQSHGFPRVGDPRPCRLWACGAGPRPPCERMGIALHAS